ncbi:MAG TPA: PAS domain-containing sensor histidine kinase [Xanthobacteraceae bacterium]|nr:PAS domain-containing sensor histidine kinase [Xanthobacteraceae bacterium]
MGFDRPIRDYVNTLMHACAHADHLTAARHRAFIATRLLTSVVGIALIPLYVALRGAPGGFEVLVFVCLATPLLVVYDLSRIGDLCRAQALSALALIGLGGSLAAASGGLTSLAALWLLLAPLEAALSASRRVVVFASVAAGAVGILLLLCQAHAWLPRAVAPPELAALSALAAAIYTGGTAFANRSLARTTLALLRAEAERYRLVAGAMSEALTRHAPDGAVLYVSPAAERLFEVGASELLGQGLYNRVHAADRRAYAVALADAAVGKPGAAEIRVRRGPARGRLSRYVWVEMRCQPLAAALNPALQAHEVIAVTQDISDRKAQQRVVEDIGRMLAESDSHNARLFATLSHELRTPLNAIIGFSQVMADELKMPRDDLRWRSYARLINQSGAHMMSVLDAMLDASKAEGGKASLLLESFDPGPAIRSCCDLLALEIRRAGLELSLRLDHDLPSIIADLRAFRQILINLISNAIKYTNRGGRIVVSARVEGYVLLISVEDTGIGVADKDLSRLADPYFQADSGLGRQQDGRGLGLSIVKSLVSLHGGELAIESRLGEGTRVTVLLPFATTRRRPAEPDRMTALRRACPSAAVVADSRVKQSA